MRAFDGRAAAGWALVVAALVTAAPASARAERVLVLQPEPAEGQASAGGQDLARVEGALIAALVTMGHEPLRDESAVPPAEETVRTLGAERGAAYVVRLRATPTQAGYVAQVRVHDVNAGTVRERSGEVARLRDVSDLTELLMPLFAAAAEAPNETGAGEGAPEPRSEGAVTAEPEAEAELADEDEAEALEPVEAEGARPEAAESAAELESAQEAWSARERARQEAAQRDAWENRERYGVPYSRLLQAGLALRPMANRPAALSASTMGAFELRFGYGLKSAPGLELRASIEGSFGAMYGVGAMAGAAYLFSPLIEAPVHFGPSVELGWLQGFADNFDQAFFAARVAAVVSWHFGKNWYLEGALPEIMLLAGESVPVTIGLALRIGWRF